MEEHGGMDDTKDKDDAVDIPIHKLKLKLNLNADVTYIHRILTSI